MTKEKQIPGILPRTCSIERIKNNSQGFIVRSEREFSFDVGVYENKSEDERLPNKSIKVKG